MKNPVERLKGKSVLYELTVRLNAEGKKVFMFNGKEYSTLHAEKLAESDEVLVLRRSNFSAEVNEGSGSGDNCRSCGAVIFWDKHPKTGRPHPFNADGTSHFATCPNAKEWRGKKRKD